MESPGRQTPRSPYTYPFKPFCVLLPETSNLLKDKELPSNKRTYPLLFPLETTAKAAFFGVSIIAKPSISVFVESISCC